MGLDENAFRRLEDALTYVQGDYREADTFDRLRKTLDDAKQPLLYLAIPPSLFETVVQGLAEVRLHEHARVVVEKPFGRDLPSSRHLNRCLLSTFPEEAVFRVDHFLGKEEVLDLLVFRFANTFLAPTWNRTYIDSVQITMSEEMGVEGRGKFYEEVGALRDVVQNHLLEVVTLVAMEPPVGADAQALRDEKVKVVRSMPLPQPNHLLFRMKPGERVSLWVQIKQPGEELVSRPVDLAYTYDEAREGIRTDAYARLLDDALKGDQRLFARADAVEEAWRVVQPILDHPPPLFTYEPGSWGPAEADALTERVGGWHCPDMAPDCD